MAKDKLTLKSLESRLVALAEVVEDDIKLQKNKKKIEELEYEEGLKLGYIGACIFIMWIISYYFIKYVPNIVASSAIVIIFVFYGSGCILKLWGERKQLINEIPSIENERKCADLKCGIDKGSCMCMPKEKGLPRRDENDER